MAAEITLDARSRTELARHVRPLRRDGQVPAILYGHGIESLPLVADGRLLAKVWQRAGRTHLVDLKVDGGKSRKVLIRQFQIDPRTARPVHADFFAVNLREKLTADVPIVVIGESPVVAVEKRGQVVQTINTLKVECLPGNLPAQLTVDVSGLTEIDAGITVGAIELPKGVVLLHADADDTVVKIAALRLQPTADEVADADAATAAQASHAESAAGAESDGEDSSA